MDHSSGYGSQIDKCRYACFHFFISIKTVPLSFHCFQQATMHPRPPSYAPSSSSVAWWTPHVFLDIFNRVLPYLLSCVYTIECIRCFLIQSNFTSWRLFRKSHQTRMDLHFLFTQQRHFTEFFIFCLACSSSSIFPVGYLAHLLLRQAGGSQARKSANKVGPDRLLPISSSALANLQFC